METLAAGSIVAFNGAEHFDSDGKSHRLFGLYLLVDHERADPAAFIGESGWWVAPHDGAEHDAYGTFVTDWEVWEQTDPKGYGRFVAEEHAQEAAQS